MKIELEIDDLETTTNALNNALVAYHDVRNSIFFCCDHDDKWDFLVGDSFDNLTDKFDERLKCLRTLYEQLLSIGKESK